MLNKGKKSFAFALGHKKIPPINTGFSEIALSNWLFFSKT